ncbi:MAG TPA: hypothetical protein VGP47_03315 [Parachlamydiaceae bacterium]|nr:hypothetical protein [Parachlamydiaceae bacterium]
MNIFISKPSFSGQTEQSFPTDSLETSQTGQLVLGVAVAVGVLIIAKLVFDRLFLKTDPDLQKVANFASSRKINILDNAESKEISENSAVQDAIMPSSKEKNTNSDSNQNGIFQGLNGTLTSLGVRAGYLAEPEKIIGSEVEAYVDIAEFANAFVFGNPDDDSAHHYYTKIPYLLDEKYGFKPISSNKNSIHDFIDGKSHVEINSTPCKKLTLGDGSSIPLTIGDFFIPIVIKDPFLSISSRDEHSRIYLPSFLVREFKSGTPVSLKYGDQKFELHFKDFDPDFKDTQWSDMDGSSLIKSMEGTLYINGSAYANHPLCLKNDTRKFGDVIKAQPRYLAPSIILEQKRLAEEQSAILQKICHAHSKNVIKVIPIEFKAGMPRFHVDVDGRSTFLAGEGSMSLQCDDQFSFFNLETKINDYAGKNVEILTFGGEKWMYEPRISSSCLSLYFMQRNHKNSLLSISDESLILWQEHLSKQEIDNQLLQNNEGITCTKHVGPDATLTYIPLTMLEKLGIDAQTIIEGLRKAMLKDGYLTIPLDEIHHESKEMAEELEKSELLNEIQYHPAIDNDDSSTASLNQLTLL